MHELSIVMSIIDIASAQIENRREKVIEEIELDIGTLSGIEMNAFDFAWKQAVKNTVLENAVQKINTIHAQAKCLDCDNEFHIEHYYDGCSKCGSHLLQILHGKELRVKSLVVS